jgi:uncharacterized protein YbaP (TraB family)
MLRQTLEDLEQIAGRGGGPHDDLVEFYLRGDGDAIMAEMDLEADDPLSSKFTRLILTERDQRMAERAAARMRGNPETSFFFAVGAAHCIGPEGVPVRLRRLGFQVERVRALADVAVAR